MNDIFDKLVIRFLFIIFIVFLVLVYKAIHSLIYSSSRQHFFSKTYCSNNSAESLHLFSKLMGIAIIFSSQYIQHLNSLSIATINFFVWSITGIVLFVLSNYILESIVLYKFDFKDEIFKHKNLTYSLIGSVTSICSALMIKNIFMEAENSFIIMIILWLYSLAIFSLMSYLYRFINDEDLIKGVQNQNLAMSLSYSGYLFGVVWIILASFNHEHYDLVDFLARVSLKVILSIIVAPFFFMGIKKLFNVQFTDEDEQSKNLGLGIYELCLYISTSLMTSIIIKQIKLGIIYPYF